MAPLPRQLHSIQLPAFVTGVSYTQRHGAPIPTRPAVPRLTPLSQHGPPSWLLLLAAADVRVPRSALLDAFSQVERDGSFRRCAPLPLLADRPAATAGTVAGFCMGTVVAHVQLDQACIHTHELGVAQACPVLQAERPCTI